MNPSEMTLTMLTIVIPTRDRSRLLELCLRSIFEQQSVVPRVFVSDNSTADDPAMDDLRKRYDFAYVRQSGSLGIVEHQNLCLQLSTTPWVLMLHDDDELRPDVLARMGPFLAQCNDAGIVVTGVETMDPDGRTAYEWTPTAGACVGEDALVALGLSWGVRAPGTLYRVDAIRELGGLAEILGFPADYACALSLAYRYGVAFWPEAFGRYRLGHSRVGHEQVSSLADPQQEERWLSFVGRQAAFVRQLGCSTAVADRIVDYGTWSTFLWMAHRHPESRRSAVFRLARVAMELSPHRGEWRDRARREVAFVFWGPEWLAWPLFRAVRKARHLRRRWTTSRGAEARASAPRRWGGA